MKIKRLQVAFLAAATGLCLALIGCGGDGASDGGSLNGGGNGTLRVNLADAPDPDITAMHVTLTRVQANKDGQWVNIPIEETRINLFDLVENDIVIAEGEIPTGDYGQVRVFVKDATVTDDEGIHPVKIPSGENTGIKLNVNYDINQNDITTLLLDFNVSKSLVRTGNGQYILKPVIPVVVKVLSGTVTGTVYHPDATAADNVDVTAVYTAGSAYPLGTEVNTSVTNENGRYKVWALMPGTYDLHFTWTDGTAVESATLSDVEVIADANTDAGDVSLVLEP